MKQKKRFFFFIYNLEVSLYNPRISLNALYRLSANDFALVIEHERNEDTE